MYYEYRSDMPYLTPFLALLFVVGVILIIIAVVRQHIEEERKRDEELLRKIVVESSEWYKNVLALNNQTRFHNEILDSGRSKHVCYVDSKAKFDRTLPEDSLYEFVQLHRQKVEHALEQVYRNRVIYEVYCKKFAALHSLAKEEECEELGVPFDKFLEKERELVHRRKLCMILDYSVGCYVRYTSPQGRNQYTDYDDFGEDAVRAALKELDVQVAYQETEAYRRKNERSRITPSLRYDIMRRNGFRCCLCGRSAKDGVELEVDHIIPISKGGTSTYDNLQTLCRDCNRGKGAKN